MALEYEWISLGLARLNYYLTQPSQPYDSHVLPHPEPTALSISFGTAKVKMS